MVLWAVFLPFSLLIMIICYITNPLVVLFCDEDGELHGFWNRWQTWDNSCNPSDVTENKELPSWLCYDWKGHYEEYVGDTPELKAVGRKRWFTRCINNEWTLLERLKRYICRVYWLTRNCSYGWSFWTFGITPGIRWNMKKDTKDVKFVTEDYDDWWFDGAWKYINTSPLFTIFGYTVKSEIFLGWKVDTDAKVDTRSMIANRIAVRFNKEVSK